MAEGRLFYLHSRLNDMVLEVEGGGCFSGARVVTYYRKHGEADNQLWYMDPDTATIRNNMMDFCLDILEDGTLAVTKFIPNCHSQQWKFFGGRLQNKQQPNLTVHVTSDLPGAPVCVTSDEEGPSIQWLKKHLPPEFFFIKSDMHGKVLDIYDDNPAPGEKVVMYDRKHPPSDNQLWYEGQRGIIRAKLNNLALDSSENIIRMQPYNPSSVKQMWLVSGKKIMNQHSGEVLDIRGGSKWNCATLCAYKYHGKSNQHWSIEYT